MSYTLKVEGKVLFDLVKISRLKAESGTMDERTVDEACLSVMSDEREESGLGVEWYL